MSPFQPIGVCSWSLQVTSVPELKAFMDSLGVSIVQIACGDPHHAAWDERDHMPQVAKAAGFTMFGAMLGFPGEDYTTPQTIARTGGFSDPETRPARLDTLRWGLARTKELGLADLTLHAGFIPPVGDAARRSFLDTLGTVAALAEAAGVVVAFETGQEPAALLRRTLDDLKSPHLKVNFDPANMLLYDQDDPLAAVELLAGDIRSVHVKDGNRPTVPGTWGTEVPLGQGQTRTAEFIAALGRIGYAGPLCIEREVGTQAERFADIAAGVRYLREHTARTGPGAGRSR